MPLLVSSVALLLHSRSATTTPEILARGGAGAMCLVQTPYYHLCDHCGRPVVAPAQNTLLGLAGNHKTSASRPWRQGASTASASSRFQRPKKSPPPESALWTVISSISSSSNTGRHAIAAGTAQYYLRCQFHLLTTSLAQVLQASPLQSRLMSSYELQTNWHSAGSAWQALLLFSHLPSSIRLQKIWLFADPAQPVRSPSPPYQPVQCRQKDDNQSSLSTPHHQLFALRLGPPLKNGPSRPGTASRRTLNLLFHLINTALQKHLTIPATESAQLAAQ